MSPPTEILQRISRLAPLAEILAKVEAFAPVTARETEPAAAVGTTVAADIAAPMMIPQRQTALRDGWAVASELILDAGPYAPVPLRPPPAWVETGQPMPPGTDAVLPVDAVAIMKAGAEAHASAAPGEGAVLAGADAAPGMVLRRAGQRFRPSDAAVSLGAGIESVAVRAPRVKIFSVSVPTRSRDDTISPVIARAVEAEGCVAQVAQAATLESALVDRGSDVIITIGGTGMGKRDAAVKTLARVGKVELHGLGISPGETAALGFVERRPVLMLPGRLDAALAAFLVAGRALLAQLSGASEISLGMTIRLTKKVTSTVGLAEVVLVRCSGEGVEPLGNGMFPLHALAQADGWILVAPESEGLAAGATVEVRALP
jgi:molybdopterin molybdotransferase